MTDVIVVGAGPVGLLTALGIAQSGASVTVLEREPEIIDSPRAMTYLWFVLDGLERLGIREDAEAAGVVRDDGQSIRVPSTGEVIRIDMASALAGQSRYPYNVHLGQDRLAEIALRHLERLPGAEVRFGANVTAVSQDESGVSVDVESADGVERLEASWLVGADGGNSIVRRSTFGDAFDGTTWPERFVATNVIFDFGSHGYGGANLVVDPVYGAVIAQIDANLWRVTYSEDAQLPEESVLDRMPAHLAQLIPGEYELVHHSPYRMHQRAAERFREGRIVLAGDAAHLTNPTGGLGLTSGLLDAFVLYEALAAIIAGEASEDILDVYSEQRRDIFLKMASPAASEFKRLVYHSDDPERLQSDLEPMRQAAADLERRRATMRGLENLITPSVVPAGAN